MKIAISIIITARNNGKYLSEAIESCLAQTIQPFEIIYSDDCSSDNSVEIAKKYKEVHIIAYDVHTGVVASRNRGVDLSLGNVLVFLDGDDILPPDFLEKHLQVFDENTPFVYCSAQAFGLQNHFWKVFAWGTLNLWNRNFVNTSSMMWRDSFIKAGKWQETCESTMWDWSLAIRLSRLGKPKKSPAILNYRQYAESWSRTKEKSSHTTLLHLTENIRKELVIVSIGLIYSGRLPEFIDKWMEVLIEDIEILNNKPELIIVNNSNEDISYLQSLYQSYFRKIQIITGKQTTSTSEIDRRNQVCEILSDQYNMILENATGDLIHLREDDIIPNKGSFNYIYEEILKGNPVIEAVAGIYLNRKLKENKVVGGFFTDDLQKTSDLTYLNPTSFKVDFTGTGFLIFWKDLCPKFTPYLKGIQAHDWAWGMEMKRQGKTINLIPQAICKHYKTSTKYLEFDYSMNISSVNTHTKVEGPIYSISRGIVIKH